nr:MAG TPA: hypothetical protein [Caudoviricetes sp.]
MCNQRMSIGSAPFKSTRNSDSGSAGLCAVLLGLGGNGNTALSFGSGDSQDALVADLALGAILRPLNLAVDDALTVNLGGKQLAFALLYGGGSRGHSNGGNSTALAVNGEGERVHLFRVVGVDGVCNLPAKTHDRTEGDHIVLHEVVNDVLRGGVLNHALGKDLEGHILANGIDELAPIADDHLRLRRVERTVHGEVHIHAVKAVSGSALHIGLEDGLASGVFQTAQLAAHLDCRHYAVRIKAVQLDLGNQAAFAHNVIEHVGTDGNPVTGSDSSRDNAFTPSAGLVRAKQNSGINDLAECLGQSGLNLAPDVIVSVIECSLGDGNDNCDFLGIQLFLVPCHLSGLLECLTGAAVSGLAVDEIRGGKCVKHVDGLRLAGHICQSAAHAQNGRFSDSALHDLAGYGFRDQARKCGTINTCHVIFSFLLLECAANQIVHRGIGVSFLFTAANGSGPVNFYAILKRGRIGADLFLVPFVKPIKRAVFDFKMLCFQVCQIRLLGSFRAKLHAFLRKRFTDNVCVVIIGNLGLVALDLLFECVRFRVAVC